MACLGSHKVNRNELLIGNRDTTVREIGQGPPPLEAHPQSVAIAQEQDQLGIAKVRTRKLATSDIKERTRAALVRPEGDADGEATVV